MNVYLKLKINPEKIIESNFFQCMNQDVTDLDTYVIEGDMDVCAYLFGLTDKIQFNKILEYWNQGTYYDLRIKDMLEQIKEHVTKKEERSIEFFDNLLNICQRISTQKTNNISKEIINKKSKSVSDSFAELDSISDGDYDSDEEINEGCKPITYEENIISTLFSTTTNILEIFTHYKKTSLYISYKYDNLFKKYILKSNDQLFDVFDIFLNKKSIGIETFLFECYQTKDEYLKKFNALNHGLIGSDFDWSNVICAREIILESLSINELNKHTEIELFVIGLDFDPKIKIKNLCDYFQNKAIELSSRAWFGENQNEITICFENIERVVKINKMLYKSIEQIIMEVHTYCESVLYDGKNVLVSKKWIQSMETKNTEWNMDREIKNEKLYNLSKKGFNITGCKYSEDLYNNYVTTGQAMVDYNRHYYPKTNVDDITNISMMSIVYSTKTFFTDGNKLIFLNKLQFKSIDYNSNIKNISNLKQMITFDKSNYKKSEKILIPLIINKKTCVQKKVQSDKKLITFETNFYKCMNVFDSSQTILPYLYVDNDIEEIYFDIFTKIVIALNTYNFKEKLFGQNIFTNTIILDKMTNKIELSEDTEIKLNGFCASIKDIIGLYKLKQFNNNDAPSVKIFCQINHIVLNLPHIMIDKHCYLAQFQYIHYGKILFPLYEDNENDEDEGINYDDEENEDNEND